MKRAIKSSSMQLIYMVAKSNNTKSAVWTHFRFKVDSEDKPKTSDKVVCWLFIVPPGKFVTKSVL